jgi:hypothetical protein
VHPTLLQALRALNAAGWPHEEVDEGVFLVHSPARAVAVLTTAQDSSMIAVDFMAEVDQERHEELDLAVTGPDRLVTSVRAALAYPTDIWAQPAPTMTPCSAMTSSHCVRLQVVSAASRRIEEGKPGMVCVGFPGDAESPPLIVVWDEGVYNEGASATNSIDSVLMWLRERWDGLIDVEQALVVECDSSGEFDHAYPDWAAAARHGRAGQPFIGWQPLRWPRAVPRSEAAFVGMFGARALATLEAVRAARGGVGTRNG